jgi:hypothetical protein
VLGPPRECVRDSQGIQALTQRSSPYCCAAASNPPGGPQPAQPSNLQLNSTASSSCSVPLVTSLAPIAEKGPKPKHWRHWRSGVPNIVE